MAKKRDPVEKHLQEVIVKALKQAKDSSNGPGSERMIALGRLCNVYLKMKGGMTGKVPVGESEAEKLERLMQTGDSSYYETLL